MNKTIKIHNSFERYVGDEITIKDKLNGIEREYIIKSKTITLNDEYDEYELEEITAQKLNIFGIDVYVDKTGTIPPNCFKIINPK